MPVKQVTDLCGRRVTGPPAAFRSLTAGPFVENAGMTSDRPPTANPPTTSPPAANPPRRGLVIALVVTVILAALTATVLVVMLLGQDSPEVGAASPTPTEQPTPESTPSPTADPTATPSPEPTPQTELTNGLTHLNYGARATVVTDRLDSATRHPRGGPCRCADDGPGTADSVRSHHRRRPRVVHGRARRSGRGERNQQWAGWQRFRPPPTVSQTTLG